MEKNNSKKGQEITKQLDLFKPHEPFIENTNSNKDASINDNTSNGIVVTLSSYITRSQASSFYEQIANLTSHLD